MNTMYKIVIPQRNAPNQYQILPSEFGTIWAASMAWENPQEVWVVPSSVTSALKLENDGKLSREQKLALRPYTYQWCSDKFKRMHPPKVS